MAGYAPNHHKKKNIFMQREQELTHAIKHGYSSEKIEKEAEKLRVAKLNVYKAEFSKNQSCPLATMNLEKMQKSGSLCP